MAAPTTPIAFEIAKHQREEMLLMERNRIDWQQMQIAVMRATGQWPNGMTEGAAYGLACFLWWLLCGRRLDDAWGWQREMARILGGGGGRMTGSPKRWQAVMESKGEARVADLEASP